MRKIRTVLVDDEYFNRELVKMMVTKLHSEFEIVAEAENVRDGIRAIADSSPHVVFLDIKMPDGSGFDLLQRIGHVNFEVVFITGFDEYALKAFDHNALDYVLKPIDQDKFKLTLERVHKRIKARLHQTGNPAASQENAIQRIPVHHQDQVMLLPLHEVMYIRAAEGCTFFYKSKEDKYVSSKQLSDFSEILAESGHFLRIDRSTYINLRHVRSYTKGNRCDICMNDGETMTISRRKKSEVLGVLSSRL